MTTYSTYTEKQSVSLTNPFTDFFIIYFFPYNPFKKEDIVLPLTIPSHLPFLSLLLNFFYYIDLLVHPFIHLMGYCYSS